MTETNDTIQSLAAYPTATGSVPIGTILPYGGQVSGESLSRLELQGYKYCNGDAIKRDDYRELFSVIGNAFGAGDNFNTFNLPDLRGQFLRGVDDGRAADPDAQYRTESGKNGDTGDKVGSYQGDAFGTHQHFGFGESFDDWALGIQDSNKQGSKGSMDSNNHYYGTTKAGGNETRPKNIYVYYIIKAKNV